MFTSIKIIEQLCKRPSMWGPEIKTANDLMAGFRGICVGLGDPEGLNCLGDFPSFLHSRFSENGNDSGYNALSQLCVGQSLLEACDTILRLIGEWKNANPIMPNEILVDITKSEPIDTDTFHLMEEALREFSTFVPGASTLREILAFLWGITVSRHPPYGSIAGIGEFNVYVNRHFHKGPALRMQVVLLSELENCSLDHACVLIADLIRLWQVSVR